MRPITPEIVEPDEALPADLLALRKLAWILDAAIPIPGMRRRVGLAPAIGLIPGVGDIVGAILSSWIVFGALRHRVPFGRVARMVLNILVDLLVGSVPILGDAIDFLFQENLTNVHLLLQYRDRSQPPRALHRIALIVAAIVAVLVCAAVAALLITILCLGWLLRVLF